MTEAEWLAAGMESPMLDFVRGRVSDRKFRLFGCAFCRIFEAHLPEEGHRLLAGMEGLADDASGGGKLPDVGDEAGPPECTPREPPSPWDQAMTAGMRAVLASAVANCTIEPGGAGEEDALPCTDDRVYRTWREAGPVFAALIRDISGNPFRPVSRDDSWLTSTVVALARQMYESRDFSAMPVLADALQDAGCDNEAVLGHCRADGPHVRGCWVVDLILRTE